MKPGCALLFLLCSALTVTITTHAQTPDMVTAAPYPLAGAPTFNFSISQFREDSNSQNPNLPLNEFHAIDSSPDEANFTRAASKINGNLYASTAPERGILETRSIQIAWLPIQRPEQKTTKAKAQAYMAAVIRTLTPLMTKTQSQKELRSLLTVGRNRRYYIGAEGTLRYAIANNGGGGLTLAVGPIKLALSESPEGLNR